MTTEPRLIIYKEVLPGDIEKINQHSNLTPSGGGARDFRFNPPKLFIPVFLKMFPKTIEDGTQEAIFHWADHPPNKTCIDIRMDKVRKEVRICQVNKCLHNIPSDATNEIFILIKNSDNTVWPYFVTRKLLLEDWNETISR